MRSILIASLVTCFMFTSFSYGMFADFMMEQATQQDMKVITDMVRTVSHHDIKPKIAQKYSSEENALLSSEQLDTTLNSWLDYQSTDYARFFSLKPEAAAQESRVILLAKTKTTGGLIGICDAVKKEIIVPDLKNEGAEKSIKQVYIKFLAIEKSQRGKGFGTTLLNGATMKFKQVDEYALSTVAEHNDDVLSFFYNRGFEKSDLITLDPLLEHSHLLLIRNLKQ